MVFSSADMIRDHLQDPELPTDLATWLSRLGLLYGVPFNYLVPDEQMLPPESIRFFYLDRNWIGALKDGALSIGRNLTTDTNSPQLNLDKAVHGLAVDKAHSIKPNIRAKIFGLKADGPLETQVITGFVLRSSLVQEYPNMGVNAYKFGETPDDPNPKMMKLLRFEQLGPSSDTLLCLIEDDAYRIDLHEAPQALHYGIDCFDHDCTVKQQSVLAKKNLHTFTITSNIDPVTGTKTQHVTMSKVPDPTDISTCFRSKKSRVIDMKALAATIATANNVSTIDSAEMGFEMTEGVGMVSFFKKLSV
jgi:hypothetical protein